MGAVFVSYRRGDSEGQARALSLELVRLLGKESVFMDVDSIALGRDFREALHQRLESCEVLVALIGPEWVSSADGAGRRRLDSPTDFVRQEIAAALKRNIPVIPLLVQGAPMPLPDQLPDDLKDLAYRNGFELGHATWESDVRELVKRLGLEPQPTLSAPSSVSVTTPVPAPLVRASKWMEQPVKGGLAIGGFVALVLVGLYFYSRTPGGDVPRDQTVVTPDAQAPTAIASTVGGGGLPSKAGTVGTEALKSQLSGEAVHGVAFDWPGDDCWNISRGTELVTFKCGTNRQALGPGRYTISGRHAPVFLPFDVEVKAGAETRTALGGVIEFRWPGDDCWDIFRGKDEPVVFKCGTNRQALSAGRYTIKGRHAPVFQPFEIEIKDRAVTRVQSGGVFTYNWKGDDCWDVVRGDEAVVFKCGTNKQALGAGTYTIRGRNAPLFEPFQIKIADGAQVVAP